MCLFKQKKVFENEYKWHLFEDEKTQIRIELSDLIFEEEIENFIFELKIW